MVEDLAESLESVVAEQVMCLRDHIRVGDPVEYQELVDSFLDPEYIGGKELSPDEHKLALACMLAVAYHLLASQEELR